MWEVPLQAVQALYLDAESAVEANINSKNETADPHRVTASHEYIHPKRHNAHTISQFRSMALWMWRGRFPFSSCQGEWPTSLWVINTLIPGSRKLESVASLDAWNTHPWFGNIDSGQRERKVLTAYGVVRYHQCLWVHCCTINLTLDFFEHHLQPAHVLCPGRLHDWMAAAGAWNCYGIFHFSEPVHVSLWDNSQRTKQVVGGIKLLSAERIPLRG